MYNTIVPYDTDAQIIEQSKVYCLKFSPLMKIK